MSDPLDRLKGLTRYTVHASLVQTEHNGDVAVVREKEHPDGEFYMVAEVHHALQEARKEDAARVAPLKAGIDGQDLPRSSNEPSPRAMPFDQWHEDYGEVLWWLFPVVEPPYVGSPLSEDWPFDDGDESRLGWTALRCPMGMATAQPDSDLRVDGTTDQPAQAR